MDSSQPSIQQAKEIYLRDLSPSQITKLAVLIARFRCQGQLTLAYQNEFGDKPNFMFQKFIESADKLLKLGSNKDQIVAWLQFLGEHGITIGHLEMSANYPNFTSPAIFTHPDWKSIGH